MNLGKETETLEYKKSTGEMKEAMVSIASILNKHGIGTLYFGVKPNGTVCGQNVSESYVRPTRGRGIAIGGGGGSARYQ